MRIEFFPDDSHDCPAILLYGCPSAGAKVLSTPSDHSLRGRRPKWHFTNLRASRLLEISSYSQGTQRALRGCSNFLALSFTGVETEKVGLKLPSLQSRWPTAIPVKEPDFSTLSGMAKLMLSSRLIGRGNGLLTRRLS